MKCSRFITFRNLHQNCDIKDIKKEAVYKCMGLAFKIKTISFKSNLLPQSLGIPCWCKKGSRWYTEVSTIYFTAAYFIVLTFGRLNRRILPTFSSSCVIFKNVKNKESIFFFTQFFGDNLVSDFPWILEK